MKNFILTVLLSFMSILAVNATPIDMNKRINEIHAAVPCRIILCEGEFTNIRSSRNPAYDIYFEYIEDVLYIKSNENEDNMMNVDDSNVPCIRVITPGRPKITADSSLTIKNDNLSVSTNKKTNGHKNGTTRNSKN